VASAHGAVACADLDELFDRCVAVVFAVPPDVQAELALRAAAAGKALLLEKPVALDLAAAERLADVVGEAGVGTQMVLTWRYATATRTFLDSVQGPVLGGSGWFVSGSALGGPFVTPWRQAHGKLLDLGPHVLDLLDVAMGTVVEVRATGDPHRWVSLVFGHATGATSTASLSGSCALDVPRAGAEVYAPDGVAEFDVLGALDGGTFTTMLDEFVQTAAGAPHPLDVHRGVHLQRLLEQARDDLERRR
jgi:predicted dehydrogenase